MDKELSRVRSRKRIFGRRNIWRITELVIILLGLVLILYPWWDGYLQEKRQLELLTEWEDLREAQQHSVEELSPTEQIAQTDSTEPEELPDQVDDLEELPMLDGEHVIGTISIDKIELLEPMLARTTEKTLNLGVGSVVPEVQPGANGNFVLAGHRSWTNGKQFNRLDELEQGDQITLKTLDDEYLYKVVSKFVVEPTGMYVLDQDVGKQEMTLITCEPLRNPTHRLIVKAILLSTSAGDETREVKPV